jgi:hypothetical protein
MVSSQRECFPYAPLALQRSLSDGSLTVHGHKSGAAPQANLAAVF